MSPIIEIQLQKAKNTYKFNQNFITQNFLVLQMMTASTFLLGLKNYGSQLHH